MKRPMLFASLIAMLLAACGKPLPADRQAYAGHWQAPGVSLLITADGRVAYERKAGAGSKSIDAPIQAFHGADFDVGVAFLKTTFVVSVPPHQEAGVWTMTVDGTLLRRDADGSET